MSRPEAPPSDQLLRPADVARRLNVGKRTLERMLSSGAFPRPDLKLGPKISLWTPATVDGWIRDAIRLQSARKGGA